MKVKGRALKVSENSNETVATAELMYFFAKAWMIIKRFTTLNPRVSLRSDFLCKKLQLFILNS